MNNIQMVDLKGQYEKIKVKVDDTLKKVIESSSFIQGEPVKELEDKLAKYIDIQHCISCGNGTDALQIAIMALGLKPGDEIIVPTYSYVAPVEAIALLGIKPVLVDCYDDTFNINIEKIKNKVSFRTRAIIPVHLFGQCADMKNIVKLAKDNDLFIIEDNAQSLGAEYKFGSKSLKAGTIGDIGITSFFPSKNLGCFGDGGALFTKDDALAEKIRMIANHGQRVKYEHEVIGMNSRLDTIQAAILNVKLEFLKEYINARQKVADDYDKAFSALKNITIPYRDPNSTHTFNQYTITLQDADREDFRKFLSSHKIPSQVYYPIPVHLQKAYGYLGYKEGDFPVAENLCKNVVSLPMHTELDNDQLSYIAENIISYFK